MGNAAAIEIGDWSPGGDGWDDVPNDGASETHLVHTARDEAGRFWAVHTSDLDDHREYYWADDLTEARMYHSPGEIFLDMHELAYSGPCTLLTLSVTVVRKAEVLV